MRGSINIYHPLAKYLLFIIIGMAFIIPQKADACEIDFEIIKNEKAVYDTSDVLVVAVTVTLTHRVCPISIQKTQFKTVGVKIAGATKWKQHSRMKYTRKLKVKVTGTQDGKLLINGIRTCDREGGSGSLVLKSVPLQPTE